MIQGLIWLFASVGCAVVLIQTIPRSVQAAVEVYRKRNIESPTKALPSAVCPVDAGAWGPWTPVNEERKFNNPRAIYPESHGYHTVRSQSRVCESCGFGERRVL